MKKITGFSIIFIVLISLVFLLKVQVPVTAKIGGRDLVKLNNKTLNFIINSPEDFDSLGINFISFNRPVGGKITFSIYDSIYSNKKMLVKHVFNQGGVPQGNYYKFSFSTLRAKKNYYLKIKGENGVPYKLRYDKNHSDSSNDKVDGTLSHKLFNSKSIAFVVFEASRKAARDWFRLGPFYFASIIAYVLLVSAIVTVLIWGSEFEKN